MNNASFHLPGRHPLLMIPNHSVASATRLLSSGESPFTMANGSLPVCSPSSQMAQLNFAPFAGNGAFPYFNFGGVHSMMPMGFGMFQQHHNLYSKSPGLASPVPSFFGNFASSKEEDLSWNKRSPSNLPDSPHSGSRSSPLEFNRKRLPKSKSLPEHNTCPICGQSVTAKGLQEHFSEELKSYQIELEIASKSSSPDNRQSLVSSTTPSDSNNRMNVFLRVKNNRASRMGNFGDLYRARSSQSSSSEPMQKRRRLSEPDVRCTKKDDDNEDADVVVDVEGEDTRLVLAPAEEFTESFSISPNRIKCSNDNVSSSEKS